MRSHRVKINFRPKGDAGTWKVVTVQRVPGQLKPKQLHLGYVPSAVPIRLGFREKLEKTLRAKCQAMFDFSPARLRKLEIDWEDAEAKLTRKILERPVFPAIDYPGKQRPLWEAYKKTADHPTAQAVGEWIAVYGEGQPLWSVLLAVHCFRTAAAKDIAALTGYSLSKVYHFLQQALAHDLLQEAVSPNDRTKRYQVAATGTLMLATPVAEIRLGPYYRSRDLAEPSEPS